MSPSFRHQSFISVPSNKEIQEISKMKLIVVAVAALVAFTMAAPVEEKKYPVVIRSEFEQKPEGAYVYDFETENGIVKQEVGELKEVKDEENIPHEVVVVRGQYSYPGDDGKPVVVSYFADETGYHAEGDSIPKV